MELHTEFASPERSSPYLIKKQNADFTEDGIFSEFLNAVPDYLRVVNESRQVVYSNNAVRKLYPGDPFASIYRKRPGELLNCKHANEAEAGCGTTKFCTECGAVKAILSSLEGKEDVEECRIIQENGAGLDLRVWTKPLKVKNQNYVIFAFTDISDEKRRKALERIFFHDVLNTAGGILGFSELLRDANGEEVSHFNETITSLTEKLVDEIKSQRDLMLAEHNELAIHPSLCSSYKIISEVTALYSKHLVATDKEIVLVKDSEDITFSTDKVLLRRVLGNMIKNALESSEEGDKVLIGCRAKLNEIEFYVHNNGFMEQPVQLQLFQRSFSTKGRGRGIGTYSMKLLTEKFLKGRVLFDTSKENGTTFYVRFHLL